MTPERTKADGEPPVREIRVIELGTGWFTEKPGGLERVFYGLLEYLAKFGVRARGLVVGSAAVETLSAGRVRGFAPADAPLPLRWLRIRHALRHLLREEPADLVSAHFALYTFPVLDIIRRVPLIVHFHGSWALESEVEASGSLTSWLSVKLKWTLERLVYRRAAHFIVLSGAFKRVLHETYGVPEAQIDIIPGGVETAAYDTGLGAADARARLGWPIERKIVLAVRRLVKRQGLENLIGAVAELRAEHPDALLYIVGTGPLKETLIAQIASQQLADHVQLLGFVPDDELALAYAAADFSVVPTTAHEGFGLITVESLAAGTPVLVTPVGGLPEVVAGLSEDLILGGSDVQSLVSGIGDALSGVLALPSREACRQYAQENFDYLTVAARTREVYAKVVASSTDVS